MEQTTVMAVTSVMLIELLDDDEDHGHQAKRRRGKTREWMRMNRFAIAFTAFSLVSAV